MRCVLSARPQEVIRSIISDPVVPGVDHPLSKYVDGWLGKAERDDVRLHGEIASLIQQHIDPSASSHVLPQCVVSKQHKLQYRASKNALIDAATLSIPLDRAERRAFEYAVTTASRPGGLVSVEPMHYGEFEMYDESPHRMKYDDFSRSGGLYRLSDAMQLCQLAPDDQALATIENLMSSLSAAETGPLKLLQIRTELAVRLRIKRQQPDGNHLYTVALGPNNLNCDSRLIGALPRTVASASTMCKVEH